MKIYLIIIVLFLLNNHNSLSQDVSFCYDVFITNSKQECVKMINKNIKTPLPNYMIDLYYTVILDNQYKIIDILYFDQNNCDNTCKNLFKEIKKIFQELNYKKVRQLKIVDGYTVKNYKSFINNVKDDNFRHERKINVNDCQYHLINFLVSINSTQIKIMYHDQEDDLKPLILPRD